MGAAISLVEDLAAALILTNRSGAAGPSASSWGEKKKFTSGPPKVKGKGVPASQKRNEN